MYLRNHVSCIDKHDWLDWRDYHVIGFVLYWLEGDNPYEHVLYIELARLTYLGFSHVSTPLYYYYYYLHIMASFSLGFIDGPVTRTSGWAVGFGRRPWRWIVGSGLGPCYYSQDRELGSPWSRTLVSVVWIGLLLVPREVARTSTESPSCALHYIGSGDC